MHSPDHSVEEQIKESILCVDKIPLLTKKLYQPGDKTTTKENLITINVSGRHFIIDRFNSHIIPVIILYDSCSSDLLKSL